MRSLAQITWPFLWDICFQGLAVQPSPSTHVEYTQQKKINNTGKPLSYTCIKQLQTSQFYTALNKIHNF